MPKSKAVILEDQVVKRQKFIQDLIDFSHEVVREKGRILKREVHSCYITTESALKDFFGFSFYCYGAYSMHGGHEMSIWYKQPQSKGAPKLVLEIKWWDVKKLEVSCFEEDKFWQRAICSVIKNKKKYFDRWDEAILQKAEKAKEVKSEREHMDQIQKESKRLAIK